METFTKLQQNILQNSIKYFQCYSHHTGLVAEKNNNKIQKKKEEEYCRHVTLIRVFGFHFRDTNMGLCFFFLFFLSSCLVFFPLLICAFNIPVHSYVRSIISLILFSVWNPSFIIFIPKIKYEFELVLSFSFELEVKMIFILVTIVITCIRFLPFCICLFGSKSSLLHFLFLFLFCFKTIFHQKNKN